MRILYNDKGKPFLANEEGNPIPPVPHQPGMRLKNANGEVSQTSLGYQYTIQTTTFIREKVITQKFYEVPGGPAAFMPIAVGTGAYMEDIKTNVVYEAAGAFEGGYVGTAQSPSQLSTVGVATSPISAKIRTWAKAYQYSVIEAEKALAYNNWNVIEAKMKALTKHWQLGLQEKAFLGDASDLSNFPGLLSNATVTVNTAIITQSISSMSPAQFQVLIGQLLAAYFANSNSTEMPDTFVLPMADYLGLGAFVNPAFPLADSTFLAVLLKVFRELTQNPNFEIKATIYGNQAVNAGYWATLGTNRYVLYRKQEDVLKLDVPVPFLLSPANTGDNFNFTGVGQAQHTGCIFYRPAAGLYLDY